MTVLVVGKDDISKCMADRKAQRFEDAVIHLQDNNPVFSEAVFLAGGPSVIEERPKRPFDSEVVELLAELSKRLLVDAEAKAFPDVVSFAFWCRRSNLSALRESYGNDCCTRLGRGMSLHIAPANVPVNFAFSFAFSHLAGNVDIIRVPSRDFPQVEIICRILNELFLEQDYRRAAFLRWSSDSEMTEQLSQFVDSRIIWGGNATVAKIRRMECKPRCLDIAFPDRYSVSIIREDALSDLSDSDMKTLAKAFFNDTYLMDQNACSSPQVVMWIGGTKNERARFWDAVRKEAVASYDLQGAIATDKYVKCFEDVLDHDAKFFEVFNGYLSVASISVRPDTIGTLRGVGGYFYEFDIDSIEEAVALLDQSCQTITYFGIDPADVRSSVIEQGVLGVDRIVPFGKAMDIGIVWDGFDLVKTLSRCVELR